MIVEVTEDISVTREHLWLFLVDPVAVRQWFGSHMILDARPGGGFREVWHDGDREIVTSGSVTAFTPGEHIALSWTDTDWPTETNVEIRLVDLAGGTRIVLTHSGWERLGAMGEALAAAHRDGWAIHLKSLARYARESARKP